MLVLDNSSTEHMLLGLNTVILLLERCPKLTVLGNLKTWRKIDFYNPQSELYFKSESGFCKLRKDATVNNWDINFDVENLDDVYKDHV